MSVKYNLGPGEYEILRETRVSHKGGGAIDYDELLLTNYNIVWTDKTKWGTVKTILAYPLKDIQIHKGKARVSNEGRVGNEIQLLVCFKDGKEKFGFSSSRTVDRWVREISLLTTGFDPEGSDNLTTSKKRTSSVTVSKTTNATSKKSTLLNVTGTLLGAYDSLMSGNDLGEVISSSIYSLNNLKEESSNSDIEDDYSNYEEPRDDYDDYDYSAYSHDDYYDDFFEDESSFNMPEQTKEIVVKCVGCHAPLTGVKGRLVKCKYCDTKQKL